MDATQNAMPTGEAIVDKKARAKKRLLIFLIVSAVGTALVILTMHVSKTTVLPTHTNEFYINDYSHVFSEATETFLTEQGEILYQRTGAQIVAVSVPTTYSDSIETFSLRLAREWGVGSADENNGVLLLFTTDEAHVRMEIGYGLEGCLNDAKCGRILDDYAVEAMRAGQWNTAVIKTWIATAQVVYAEYGQNAPVSLSTLPAIDESAGENTRADAAMPSPVSVADKYTVPVQIIASFMACWIIAAPIVVIASLTKRHRMKISARLAKEGYDPSDTTSRGNSGYYSSDRSDSSYTSSDSGNSGGGGSFGGGGATR